MVAKTSRSCLMSFNLTNVGELNSEGLYLRIKKNLSNRCLCSYPAENVKYGSFTSWSCNDGKEMNKKCVKYVQRRCFANPNLLLFCRSRCRCCRGRQSLSFLITGPRSCKPRLIAEGRKSEVIAKGNYLSGKCLVKQIFNV